MIDRLLHIDWDQVRFKRALSSTLVVLVALTLLAVGGDFPRSVALAAVFVIAAAADGVMRQRLPGMVRMTAIGAGLGLVAFLSLDDPLLQAFVLGGVAAAGTLAAGFGPGPAMRGLFLTLWVLLSLMMGSTEGPPGVAAAGFLVGGSIAIAVTWIRLRVSPPDNPPVPATASSWAEVIRGPVGAFSALRGLAVLLAVIVGFWWFEAHALWTALTVLVVMKPAATDTYSAGLERTFGTAVGVVIAIVIAQIVGTLEIVILSLALVSTYLMVAFMRASYPVFVMFLSAMLVFAMRLVTPDAFDAGWQRLLATLTGAVIAFAAMAASQRLKHPAATDVT